MVLVLVDAATFAGALLRIIERVRWMLSSVVCAEAHDKQRAIGLTTPCVAFQVRGGRLTGRLGFTYRVDDEGLSRGDVLQACLERYWGDALRSARTAAGGSRMEGLEPAVLPPSLSLEGGGGKAGRGVAALDVPEEIVTADALPAGGATLLSELLSVARKRAAAAAAVGCGAEEKEEEEALRQQQGEAGGPGGRKREGERPRGGGGGRNGRRKSPPPVAEVRVVHGGSGTGERHHLCVMALKNAELEAKRLLRGGEAAARGPSQLARMLGLASAPSRVEGYDVSHTGGGQAVASVVCFVDGKASPKNHRRYRIRSPEVRKGHSDDYASLREVIARRFSPPRPPSPTATATTGRAPPVATDDAAAVPELVVIDGGKGQLAAALEGAAIAAAEWGSVAAADGRGTALLPDVVTGTDAAAWPSSSSSSSPSSSSSSSSVVSVREREETARDDPDAVLFAAAPAVAPAAAAAERLGQDNDAGGVPAGGWGVDVGGGRRATFVSLAKKEEEVFVPGASEPLSAALEAGPTSPAVMLLRQVSQHGQRVWLTGTGTGDGVWRTGDFRGLVPYGCGGLMLASITRSSPSPFSLTERRQVPFPLRLDSSRELPLFPPKHLRHGSRLRVGTTVGAVDGSRAKIHRLL